MQLSLFVFSYFPDVWEKFKSLFNNLNWLCVIFFINYVLEQIIWIFYCLLNCFQNMVSVCIILCMNLITSFILDLLCPCFLQRYLASFLKVASLLHFIFCVVYNIYQEMVVMVKIGLALEFCSAISVDLFLFQLHKVLHVFMCLISVAKHCIWFCISMNLGWLSFVFNVVSYFFFFTFVCLFHWNIKFCYCKVLLEQWPWPRSHGQGVVA